MMALLRVAILVVFAVCSVFGLRNGAAREFEDTKILYVIDNSSNCSSLTTELNEWECHPLSFYIKNVSRYFTNNTRMIITAGEHTLPMPSDSHTPVVNVTGISNFSMIGIGAVKYGLNVTDEGAPQPSSVISCTYHNTDQRRNGILFHKSSSIHIENLTIEDCGAKFTVHGPDNFKLVSALTFRESYDIKLSQVRIEGSLGFGLDADRIFGSFRISRSAFLRSKAFRLTRNKNIGGNARLWYSKYNTSSKEVATRNNTLNIYQSWFMHGCLNDHKGNRGFNFASGLIVRIFIPSVSVTINNVTVKHNIGTHGGNLAILVTDFHESTSTICINDSVIENGSAIRGGGMQFWVQVNEYRRHFSKPYSYNMTLHRIMVVTKTQFVNNSAVESGGGIYIGHYQSNTIDNIVRHVSFKDCTFYHNSVHYMEGKTRSYSGAAIEVIRHNINDFVPHTVPQYSIDFNGCQFENNTLKDVKNEGGILDFVSTQSVNITNCNFTFNDGTAISLRQSNIEFTGKSMFKGNKGRHGGALKFCELSKMYLPNDRVHIDFIENAAYVSGGAIYVSQQLCLETAPPCFFQPIRHKNSSVEDLNINLHFTNNTAEFAGDAIYGGQVDYCYLYYSSYDNDSTYLSKRAFKKIFNLTEQRESLSTVSSLPYGACFYDNETDHLDCDNKTYNSTVFPGQSFTLDLVAVGQHNGISPVRSNLYTLEQICDADCYSQLEIKTKPSNEQHNHYASLECVVNSNQSVATFNLTVEQASQAELRYVQYQSRHLTINIGECPWGFKLSEEPPYTCECDSLLIKHHIPCDIDTQHITRWGLYWLGCANTSEVTNGTDCEGIVLAVKCVHFYCVTRKTNITSSTLDNQCSIGHEGTLCGRCKANYSLALGTPRCLPSCPDYMVYIVVVLCAVGGVMLILFLTACNFTVSEGMINGLFFYAHVMHKNAYVFFPGTKGTSNTNIFRLFIAWLNLDFGFEVCFYRSMTQYHKVWLQFGFLFYIWVLKFLIVMMSRKYIFFTRLVGRNVVKVLATLTLVCFPLMFNTALGCLDFVFIHHSDGHKTTIWGQDGNLEYLSGKHIPLFILGMFLCLVSFLYTVALLFIQCLQKKSNFFCINWSNKLKPFFDAYTGPCNVHYRFWPGGLYLVRMVIITLNSILINKHNVNLYIVVSACVIVEVIALVLPNGVYKRWRLNVLESTFFINLGIVSGLVAFFSNSNPIHNTEGRTPYIVFPSVALTMVLFAGILAYHCTKQLQSYSCCRKISLSAITKRLRFNRLSVQAEVDEEREPFIHEDMRQVVRFNQYRETLIED